MLSLYFKLVEIKSEIKMFPSEFLEILLKRGFQTLGQSQPLLQTSLLQLNLWESWFDHTQSSLIPLVNVIKKDADVSYSLWKSNT